MDAKTKLLRFAPTMLAAIASFVVLSYASELAFHAVAIPFHPDGATLSENFSWMATQCRYMLPALSAVMFLAVFLPPMRARVYVFAIVCTQCSIIARATLLSDSTSVPVWLWILTLVLVPAVFVSGFWAPIRRRWDERCLSNDLLSVSTPNVG